jgi:hypothetical protein
MLAGNEQPAHVSAHQAQHCCAQGTTVLQLSRSPPHGGRLHQPQDQNNIQLQAHTNERCKWRTTQKEKLDVLLRPQKLWI